MNRVFRKRSHHLFIAFTLFASLAFAYGFFLPTPLFQPAYQLPPDSVYSPKSPGQDSIYQAHLTRINRMFGQKRYQECLVELKKARKLKPNVPSIQERIIRVEGLIAQEKKNDQEYAEMINKADDYFGKQDYLNAKASYQLAIDIKPDDPSARDKLGKTMKLLRSQKAHNILFDVAVAAADKLFDAGKYEKAKVEYANANMIMPEASYPREKINAIIKIQVDLQVREELYRNAITAGDRFYQTKSYHRALQEFQNALKQKPDEPYPQEKVSELTRILQELAALEEAYKQAIAAADQLFAEVRYADARTGYQDALKLKPKESYPVSKIREIDQILAQITKVDADYDHFLNLADSLYIGKNFIRARQNYQLALQVKPNESYPKAMITKTEAGVGEQQASELIMAEAYRSALAAADRLFGEKAYAEAKLEYMNALEIKPEEAYPRQKISEIDELVAVMLAQQKEIDEQYDRILANADRMFTDNLYSQARQQYQSALELKPQEAYPKQKIEELDGILANLEQQRIAAIANQEALNEQYDSLIAAGDTFLSDTSYLQAKESYTEALALKPSEQYPASKIREIDGILAEAIRLEQRYEELILTADQLFESSSWAPSREAYQQALTLRPEEAYPVKQIEVIDEKLRVLALQEALDQEYQGMIHVAESFFTERSYDSARMEYTRAGELKPEESLPGNRIAQIDSILLALANQQLLDERYAGLVTVADQLFADAQYQGSLTKFKEANALKPEEAYPREKITEIDAILAEIARQLALDAQYAGAVAQGDSLFGLNLFLEAKGEFQTATGIRPEESYPKQKLAEIETALLEIATLQALDEQYQQAVDAGDRLFADQSWDTAIASFRKALELKPAESYPALKITEIDSIKQEIARLLALETEYRAVMQEAERMFAAMVYDSARLEFTRAGGLKPEESLPGSRIAQIDSILLALANQQLLDERYAGLVTVADQLFADTQYQGSLTKFKEANALKPEEAYPREKITEIDAILAEIARQLALDAQYAGAVAQGDSLFALKLFTEAKGEFQTATGIRPEESYPKQKLAEIETALLEIATLQALDEQYQQAVDAGDRLFADQSWDPAIASFRKALELKPAESYPASKIAEIDSIKQEIVRQLAIDEEYARIITDADQRFASRAYDSARTAYTQAGELRPAKPYWQDQVTRIDRILAEIRKQNEDYLAAISRADGLLTEEQYEAARDEYQNALIIKTSESYPKEKISEINQILAELEGKRNTFDRLVANGDSFLAYKDYYKAKDTYQQALDLFPEEVYPKDQIRLVTTKIDSIYRANRADYDKAVGEGNGFFNTFEYDRAIDAYTRALVFLPMEDYPREMIAKIRKTILENAIADVLNEPIVIKVGEEQKFPFNPVNIASRRNNFIYMKIRNLADDQFNILVRYGKDDQINGGLAIRNISADGEVNERLISVKNQDPWYREDNNWISLYPQGGDIEVSFIQVSRAIQ